MRNKRSSQVRTWASSAIRGSGGLLAQDRQQTTQKETKHILVVAIGQHVVDII